MQSILHTAIIAIPATFAALMVLDLIANLKQLWIACNPSIPVSTPASTPQLLLEVAALAEEPEELKIMPDPWELEAFVQPITTTSRLTIVPSNLLLLPPAKSVIEVAETVTPATRRKAGRPSKKTTTLDAEFSPNPVAKRRGRPRKTA
jgi:hypothetical protein